MRWLGLGVIVLLAAVLWWRMPRTDASLRPLSDAPAAASGDATARSGDVPTDRDPAATAGDSEDAFDTLARREAVDGDVRGRLLQRGAPRAGVPLLLLTDPPTSDAARSTTDADGRFSFATPTQRFVVAGEPGAAPRQWCSEVFLPRSGPIDLGDLHLPVPGAIEVTVRDRDGRALVDARLTAARSGTRWNIAKHDPIDGVRTDTRGVARLDGLCPGGWHVDVHAAGRRSGAANVDVPVEGAATAVVELWAARRHTGALLDWRGTPLPGAEVTSIQGDGHAISDDHGWFAIDDTGDGTLHVRAAGHLDDYLRRSRADRHGDHGTVRLRRAVTLRGVVHGARDAAVTIVLRGAPEEDDAAPYDLLDKPLPVGDDGTFAIDGLGEAKLLVQAFAAGVGSSPVVPVDVRGDTGIELTVVAENSLRVLVRDEYGTALDGAELIVDPRVAEYPSLYQDSFGGVLQRILQAARDNTYAAANGVVVVPRDAAMPFACAAQLPGHLAAYRVLAAGEAPEQIVLELRRGGTLSGVVHGGDVAAHSRSVELWRVADEPAIEAARSDKQPSWDRTVPWPRSAKVDASGRFVVEGLEPGAWRIAQSRGNLAKSRSSGSDPPQPVGAVPLIDDGQDRRQIVDFTITPGATTEVELQEPPLGMLRGRVLLRGAPCADVRVFAVRPDWQAFSMHQQLTGERVPADWDDELTRSWTASTLVDADGAFAFHYRDAGPVELRVRHERGAATQPPLVVELPPPGADVVRDLTFAVGAIRGRFALEQLEPRDRKFVSVVLYPPHKATVDPSYSTDWRPAVSWSCSKVEFDEQHDGAFAFDYLPDGDWLVRVQQYAFACDPGPLWQRLVTIENGAVVELDDISPTPRVTATLSWRWLEDRAPGSVYGVWLHHAASTPTPQWCGTFPIQGRRAAITAPPGRYTVVPFGFPGGRPDDYFDGGRMGGITGITGSALAEPAEIEVHAAGSITPAEVVFTPLSPPAK